MSTPNYQHCLGFCSGLDKNCLHYERTKIYSLCKHYKAVHQHTKTIRKLDEVDIEKLIELAGSIH